MIISRKMNGKITLVSDARNPPLIDMSVKKRYELFDPSYLEIRHVNSAQNKCIQAVDFVVGAIARNYEHLDSSFYEIIDKNVKIALDFFNGKIDRNNKR